MIVTCDRCGNGPVRWRLIDDGDEDDDGGNEYDFCHACASELLRLLDDAPPRPGA